MGHYYVFDRKLSYLPDRHAQTFAVYQTSSGVDNRHSVLPHDEPDVGDSILILRCYIFIDTATNVNPCLNLIRSERSLPSGRLS